MVSNIEQAAREILELVAQQVPDCHNMPERGCHWEGMDCDCGSDVEIVDAAVNIIKQRLGIKACDKCGRALLSLEIPLCGCGAFTDLSVL